jgi:hypothetical protein
MTVDNKDFRQYGHRQKVFGQNGILPTKDKLFIKWMSNFKYFPRNQSVENFLKAFKKKKIAK